MIFLLNARNLHSYFLLMACFSAYIPIIKVLMFYKQNLRLPLKYGVIIVQAKIAVVIGKDPDISFKPDPKMSIHMSQI